MNILARKNPIDIQPSSRFHIQTYHIAQTQFLVVLVAVRRPLSGRLRRLLLRWRLIGTRWTHPHVAQFAAEDIEFVRFLRVMFRWRGHWNVVVSVVTGRLQLRCHGRQRHFEPIRRRYGRPRVCHPFSFVYKFQTIDCSADFHNCWNLSSFVLSPFAASWCLLSIRPAQGFRTMKQH